MMFSLQDEFRKWRKNMLRNPSLSEGDVAELESHLRDEIARLIDDGLDEEAAFKAAAGEPDFEDALADEYRTVRRLANVRPFWHPSRLMPSLIWNYMKLALRKMRSQKGYSLINTAGLAVGMAACLLIFLWVRDELSFNRFHENVDDIYLVVGERANHRGEFVDNTPVPLAERLRNDYPEISKVVRIQFRRNIIVRWEEKIFNDWEGAYIDPGLFEAFTFPFSEGDAESAFKNLNSVVLTESSAERLFGGADPVGQMMEIEGKLVAVTGLLRDIPKNSDIQADYFRPFLSMEELTKYAHFIWNWFSCKTFVVLKEGVDPASINPKISDLLNTNRPWSTDPFEVSLFPLKDLHLHALAGGGPIKYVYIFIVVAVMILSIACINFVNLSTARSAKRAKEVGLRKVVGSDRRQLVIQFFLESIFFTILSAVIAVFIALLCMPIFNELARKQIRFDPWDPGLIFGLIGMAIITGILAGFYPALVLSSFQPADVIKGNLLLRRGRHGGMPVTGTRFRQGMVVTQFILSIGLIVCALVVFRQLDYMRNADMGFDKDNLVRISIPEKYQGKWEILKTDLAQNVNIASVTATSSPNHGGLIDWDQASGDLQYLGTNTDFWMVDLDYIDTHKMIILEGRNFSREFPSDLKSGYLINEEAVKKWDFKDPVGKRFALVGAQGRVVGVYKNQHFGLKDNVMPCVLYLNPKTDWDRYNFLTARLKAGHVLEAMEDIKKTWKSHVADIPLEYHFVDEMIDELYQSEERLSRLINVFTLLAVAISCLGLFAMASYIAQQKTKEIGIRKVLGASASRIIVLMTSEIVGWIIIASIVAWPISFLAMRSWLNDYPYRVKIGIGIFVVSGLVALSLALVTVIGQAAKSAVANPVDSLRYE